MTPDLLNELLRVVHNADGYDGPRKKHQKIRDAVLQAIDRMGYRIVRRKEARQ